MIKDGRLALTGTSTMTGNGVGFYITGDALATVLTLQTHVSLPAPVSGPLAGLLFFEDRAVTAGLMHRISSDDARTLIGTIYLPRGSLLVDAKQPVAEQSAYTAIIAQSIELNSGPNLILNTNYDSSDVPVPSGIAGST